MKTIVLKKPIELKAKDTGELLVSIDKLDLREPVFGDLVAFDQGKGQMDGIIHLSARLAGIEVANMRTLGLEDTIQVHGAVQDFLPEGPQIGRRPVREK